VSVISTSLSFSNKHKAVSHRTVERRIGADVAIGPRCNIVGGGTYNTERLDVPMWKQGVRTGYSVLVEDDIWLSAAVSVLGGVRVGHGSIVGAGADRSDGAPAPRRALATDAVDRVGSREACDPRRFGRYAFQNLPS
jgi:maltose O-acetyltransferase